MQTTHAEMVGQGMAYDKIMKGIGICDQDQYLLLAAVSQSVISEFWCKRLDLCDKKEDSKKK